MSYFTPHCNQGLSVPRRFPNCETEGVRVEQTGQGLNRAGLR
uniref:Uncharacterized protein n=1 Tax=Anguilla anguilla TaxID=7936 RepID=A0A0E9W2H5_ANGAN